MIFLASVILAPLVSCRTEVSYEPASEEKVPESAPTLTKIDVPVSEPRPEFIQAVSPEEYGTVPRSLYDLSLEGVVGHGIASPEQGFRSSICVRPLLRPLVEKGDRFEDSPAGEQLIWDRMTLKVDGDIMQAYGTVYNRGLPILSDPEGPLGENTLWLEGGDYCWKAPMEAGRHQVVFQFRRTSGEVAQYSWLLEITD
jgi:hypothetical protein